MGTFAANKKSEGDAVVISLQGQIDEDASFTNLDLSSSPNVMVDLDKVTAINSCGIREWIKWIRTAPPSAAITYRKCPKVIVDQINMVAGFLPTNAKVGSFYVPYYSESSGDEKMILFESGTHYDGSKFTFPDEVKDNAGELMEMDVIEAKYFKFLK